MFKIPEFIDDNSSSVKPKADAIHVRTRTIYVNTRQKGNPLLQHVLAVPYEFSSDIIPDYIVGAGNAVLYLSVRYHRLHPDYIYDRIKLLPNDYKIKILLLQLDVDDCNEVVRELSILCIRQQFTLICAWSVEEAGRVIESYKVNEDKPADTIKERGENTLLAQLTECLVSVQGINKSDVMTLITTFGSFHNIVFATEEELSRIPGLGPTKVSRLLEAFNSSFMYKE